MYTMELKVDHNLWSRVNTNLPKLGSKCTLNIWLRLTYDRGFTVILDLYAKGSQLMVGN